MPIVWTELQPIGNVDRLWQCGAMDADGSFMMAGNLATNPILWPTWGRLYISTDSGATWAETQPAGNVALSWSVAACDSTGTYLVAAVNPGRLYTSADGGATWTERTPDGIAINYDWSAAAVSSTGQYMVVGKASADGRIYTSSDFGVTWVERYPYGFVPPPGASGNRWIAIACSSDGSHIIAGDYYDNDAAPDGRLFTSANYGVTWTERQPAGNIPLGWTAVGSSSNGDKLIAASSFLPIGAHIGRVWTSIDYGATWAEQQPAGAVNKYWRGAATSYCDNLFVSEFAAAGRVYSSADAGASWVEEDPYVSLGKKWTTVSATPGGDRILLTTQVGVPVGSGRLYLGVGPAPPPPPPPPAPVVPVPSPNFLRFGKTPIKCANVWDWCLENDQRLWASIEWAQHGCIPVKCWRLEDNPLHAIPEQGREFHKYGLIPLPPAPSVDTPILQFQVPLGYDGVVYSILCKYTGAGFVAGSGDLLWRVRINDHWVRSLRAVPTELGDYSGYMQLDEFFKVQSGQIIRAYGWVSPLSGLMGGSMIAALQGWYFPLQFAR